MDTIERIIFLIENRFESDAAFERFLALPEKKVYDWKCGRSKTYSHMIPEIANALNTTTAYLLCETNDPSPPSDKPIKLNDVQIAFSGSAGEGLNQDDIKTLLSLADNLRKKNQVHAVIAAGAGDAVEKPTIDLKAVAYGGEQLQDKLTHDELVMFEEYIQETLRKKRLEEI